MDCRSGAHVDSCRIFCGDDCLGVVESYSDYFLGTPKLEFLDIASYGPAWWYVRNQGNTALPLVWPHGQTWEVPADRQVYRLQTLTAQRDKWMTYYSHTKEELTQLGIQEGELAIYTGKPTEPRHTQPQYKQ